VCSVSAAAAQPSQSRLRVVHAAPDAAAVDVFHNGALVSGNWTFGKISDYLAVPAGQGQLAISPAGEGVDSAIISLAVTLDANQAYTVAAVGLENVTAQLYTDDVSSVASDKVRVRVIHAVPDAPAADVEVVDGPTLIQNLAFPNASTYIEVAPGTYDLQVVALGDTNAFLQLPGTKLDGGNIYDVVAVGRLANINVSVGVYAPSASDASDTQTLPSTGVNSSSVLLVVISLGLVSAGALLTRRSGFAGRAG
jgi:LPXTG-motif cell wall-anchored protein